MINRGELKTEQQNSISENIDLMSIKDILLTINKEDKVGLINGCFPLKQKIDFYTIQLKAK